jgi:flavin reductase (DIM6/NTAB) family NADH-FMN oxidoreductase RutF
VKETRILLTFNMENPYDKEQAMSDDPIKDVLRMLPYGFYAITSKNDSDVNAMVGTWLTQASFEPRLIVFALQKSAYSHQLISQGRVFTVNLFNGKNEDAIKPFTKSYEKDPDKLRGVEYNLTPETGCPILPNTSAWLECRVQQIVDIGGDHDLVVGEVVGAAVLEELEAAETLSLPDIGWSYAG